MKLDLSHGFVLATGLSCITLLGLAAFPGRLETLFITSIYAGLLLVPVFFVFGVIFFIIRLRRGGSFRTGLRARHLASIVLLVALTAALLVYRVPLRVGFALSMIEFEVLMDSASMASPVVQTPTRAGIYTIKSFARDGRGGAFFRTHEGSSGPDTISYGFVLQPNERGTPFGAAQYRLTRIAGEWYYFEVSNDW